MTELTSGVEFREQQQRLDEELQARLSSGTLPTANILVAGITGTGKSTMVNAIFGEEMAATGTGEPVTKQIKSYHKSDIPVHIWDTVGLELNSSTTKESIAEIKQTIAKKSSSNDPFDRMHCIWYCINSGSNRYQDAEISFIKELYSLGVPFIIILTQCWANEEEVNNFEKEIRRINSQKGLGDIDIVQILAQEMKIRGLPPIQPFGLDTLVDATLKKLPDFIKSGFVAAQKVSKKEKRAEGAKIIMEYVNAAQNGVWSNLPIANIFSADNRIRNLFQQLVTTYNMTINKKQLDALVLSFDNETKKGWLKFTPTNILKWKEARYLILPFPTQFDKELEILFSQNSISEEMNNKVAKAKVIAFYGYIFMDSVDQLWDKYTKEALKSMDDIVSKIAQLIKEKLEKFKN